MARFEVHSHTHYSNIRLLDSINKPDKLIERAEEIGLSGIAITDHEALCGHIKINKIIPKNPNFKIALGNEIYLTNTRIKNQKYFHFILIAKNSLGHKMLRELSSKAWIQCYHDRGKSERVPTLKSELLEVINKYGRGNLIATTACLGGELSSLALAKYKAIHANEKDLVQICDKLIAEFIYFCKDCFENDFYIECAPGQSNEQVIVNMMLQMIAYDYNIKMVIGSDAHYLKKEDRYVHKSYLNSQDGQREVDSFYEYAYLQDNEDIFNNLKCFDEDFINQMIHNSEEIYDKIENYSLLHSQQIPTAKIPFGYNFVGIPKNKYSKYKNLTECELSEDIYDRYWLSECLKGLKTKNLWEKEEYWERLEEECRIKRIIGNKLNTNMLS